MLGLRRMQDKSSLPNSYVSNEAGIRGILKDSCEDFVVQEIDKNGKIVELVNKEPPPGKNVARLCTNYRRECTRREND